MTDMLWKIVRSNRSYKKLTSVEAVDKLKPNVKFRRSYHFNGRRIDRIESKIIRVSSVLARK